MKLREYRIPAFVCLIFLISAPIGQIIFGYLGGYLSYLVSEILPYKAHEVSVELMIILSLISLTGFWFSKNRAELVVSSFFSALFICIAFLFFSIEYGTLPEYFYSDRFIFGALISFTILSVLTYMKNNYHPF